MQIQRLILSFSIVAFSVLAFSRPAVGAEAIPASGLYQINFGMQIECCTFAGQQLEYPLPSADLFYVHLSVSSTSNLASMTLLGLDAKTVLSLTPCPVTGPIQFVFPHGQIGSNSIVFDSAALPVPSTNASWKYTVLTVGGTIYIDGTLRAVQRGCFDVPLTFTHGFEATLFPGPKLTVLERSNEGAQRIMVQGHAGYVSVVEGSTNLVHWTAFSTNFMNFTLCPICPFEIAEDPASRDLPFRFYRAYETR